MIACQNEYESIALLLLDRGADINLADINADCLTGATALMRACQNGQESIALLLLDRGADINLTDKVSYLQMEMM